MVQVYKNLGRNSGVAGYEIGEDWIIVIFTTGSRYLYNYQSTGVNNIEKMKELAEIGSGLNSFIGLYVKKNYARRLA